MKINVKKKKPSSYKERSYRQLVNAAGLLTTIVQIEETDLHILADRDVTTRATDLILQYRSQLEKYIFKNPLFAGSLNPIPSDPLAPPIVRAMIQAGGDAGVGPMAAVAGAVAQYVGRGLLESGCEEVMVENGGDIFLHRKKSCSVAIFAGESPLSYKVGLHLPGEKLPMGICTSSGTVGHSLSLGKADSVTVMSNSTPLADAAATRLGNEVGYGGGGKAGMEHALKKAGEIPGITGVIVICDALMGAFGDVELVQTDL